ncbi:MAG: polysaccharide deacetylase 2 family uncharacterized protein YibQ [Myxococcota bacterium]
MAPLRVAAAVMLLLGAVQPATAEAPKLAIVIDDVGLRTEPLDIFLEIDSLRGKITWAVIPSAVHAVALTRRLVALGEPVIAHIPMEPKDKRHIAKHLGNYLRVGMSGSEIETEVERQLDLFPSELRPFVRGINNHQGSGLTASKPSMTAVLTVLKRRGLYFLDSRTTAATVTMALARTAGVPHVQRDVFLDNERNVDRIVAQLDAAAARAQTHGSAVAIGHPYPETATALAYWVNHRLGRVRLVPVETLTRGMVRPLK